MTKQARIYRQGDVWIYRISDKPPLRSLKTQKPTDKGLILAEGEVTGHHHRIPVEEIERAILRPTANPGVRLLHVKDKPVSLVHEEHETIHLPPGTYEVRIQREYAPTERSNEIRVYD